jgi:hypothetical protein
LKSYRFYVLDRTLGFTIAKDRELPDDQQAEAHARTLLREAAEDRIYLVEAWAGDRLVCRITR